jgi:ATP-dependent DNA helicase RecG
MRPALLDPLFAPVTALDGVGSKLAGLIGKVTPSLSPEGSPRIGDLLFLAPHSVIDRRARPKIMEAHDGAIVTLELRIDRHQPPPRGRANVPYRVFGHDETGEIALVFFRGRSEWLSKALPEGERVLVSGRFEWFNGRASMVHPDHMTPLDRATDLPLVEPVYPLTAGLSAKLLRKAIGAAVDRLPLLDEWIDAEVARRQTFPSFAEALRRLHDPRDALDVSPDTAHRRRLAYDEFLAGQLSLGLVRQRVRKLAGRPLTGDGALRAKIRAALPFSLTRSQEQALAEIARDLEAPERMIRLLQGDVGSGKTAVALLAAAQAIEAGGQAAIMAPTEILARQHMATIAPVAARAGIETAILTGREKGLERQRILDGLASGAIGIVLGTHALFQENVAFKSLALAVVDEQHRFGVHQRLRLTAKGEAPHMLVMTATPIPRTLVLTAFGDMDVSKLTEKPAGRKPVHTVTLPFERFDELVGRIGDAIARGDKAYWICPLVEESDEVKLTSAEERFAALKSLIGGRVGLVHGRMKASEKDAAMAAFKDGATRLLVSTTVVEVGVDVPDATIMVIEHAERFGLAQLHQLRGRVGRSDKASSCTLLYKAPLGETARARLAIMRETEDGFRIAEEDLKLRGEGDVLGTAQSGTPGFRIASVAHHGDLLDIARDDARLVLAKDPQLETMRGTALRHLLYIFGRDEAVRLLRAG